MPPAAWCPPSPPFSFCAKASTAFQSSGLQFITLPPTHHHHHHTPSIPNTRQVMDLISLYFPIMWLLKKGQRRGKKRKECGGIPECRWSPPWVLFWLLSQTAARGAGDGLHRLFNHPFSAFSPPQLLHQRTVPALPLWSPVTGSPSVPCCSLGLLL